MLDFLPNTLKRKIFSLFDQVLEIRIRKGRQILASGIKDGAFIKTSLDRAEENLIFDIVMSLCGRTVYSKEQSLKMGYITSECGERVGVCGECVSDRDEIESIKSFTSLCIRIPNDIIGCSNELTDNLRKIESCLVISPPSHGKTTFIRDLGRVYSNVFNADVLFIDERDELSGGGAFDLGKSSDVLRYCTKAFGFYNGVRSYNPDVIVCDELMTDGDCEAVEFAMLSGVKTIASCHSDNLENLLKKKNIFSILQKNVFEKIVVLDNFIIKRIYERDSWQNLL